MHVAAAVFLTGSGDLLVNMRFHILYWCIEIQHLMRMKAAKDMLRLIRSVCNKMCFSLWGRGQSSCCNKPCIISNGMKLLLVLYQSCDAGEGKLPRRRRGALSELLFAPSRRLYVSRWSPLTVVPTGAQPVTSSMLFMLARRGVIPLEPRESDFTAVFWADLTAVFWAMLFAGNVAGFAISMQDGMGMELLWESMRSVWRRLIMSKKSLSAFLPESFFFLMLPPSLGDGDGERVNLPEFLNLEKEKERKNSF